MKASFNRNFFHCLHAITYLFMFMLAATSSKAQSNAELDRKNGFLEFKFGTPPSTYTGKIKKLSIKEVVTGEQTYEVTDSAYKRVLGYDVFHIRLHFADNKLWAISIDFIREDEDKAYTFIDYKLTHIFGDPLGTINPADSHYLYYLTGHRWKGEKTTLDLMKSKEKQTDKYFASIYYIDNDLEKKAFVREF